MKNLIQEPINEYFELESFDGEIDDVIAKLTALSKKYKTDPTHRLQISLDKDYGYYSDETTYNVVLSLTRVETNEEEAARILIEEAAKAKDKIEKASKRKKALERDKAEYERLKKKFEK